MEAASAEPRLATPMDAPMPVAAIAAPFAPPRQVTPTPVPIEPAPPFLPTAGSSAAAASAMVAGPLGAVPADPAAADALHRPITSVTRTAPALAHVPTGPRLGLRVESGTSIIATLDGDSEPISLDELRAAAAALARADGSATITTSATQFEARSLAEEAVRILADAHVPATLEG
jgi:hypothetical protein